MRKRERIIIKIILFILIYFSINYIYKFCNGQYAYVLVNDIESGSIIEDKMVKRVRINSSLNIDDIEIDPIKKYSVKNMETGKILYKKDLTDDLSQLKNEKIMIDVKNVDNMVKKYIEKNKFVNIYYIKNNNIEKSFYNTRIIDIEIVNNNSNEAKLIIDLEKENARQMLLLKKEGNFEVGF